MLELLEIAVPGRVRKNSRFRAQFYGPKHRVFQKITEPPGVRATNPWKITEHSRRTTKEINVGSFIRVRSTGTEDRYVSETIAGSDVAC